MLPSFPGSRQNSNNALPDRVRAAAFAALYGPFARVYDAFTAWLFLGEWSRWQRLALPLLPDGGVVVELGSGTGVLAAVGVRGRAVWIGIEPSAAMLAVARRRRGPSSPRFVRANAAALPVRTASVDAVVATFPAPYILAPQTARELRRILKPGGRVVVVLSGELAAVGPRRRFRRAALRAFYGRGRDRKAFELGGFAGRTEQMTSWYGTAEVYVGRREAPREGRAGKPIDV